MTDPVPSKDLLTRLRTGYLCEVEGCKCHAIEARSGCQCAETADEIERLQAQIATLKGYIERTALAGYRCAECAARLTDESLVVEATNGFGISAMWCALCGSKEGDSHLVGCPYAGAAQPPGAGKA